MKIRKYQKLCEVCDQILTKNISNPQIVANNYLHVLNSHPDFLKRYKLSNIKKALLSLRFTFIYLVRIINSLFESKCFFANKKNIALFNRLMVRKAISRSWSWFQNVGSEWVFSFIEIHPSIAIFKTSDLSFPSTMVSEWCRFVFTVMLTRQGFCKKEQQSEGIHTGSLDW